MMLALHEQADPLCKGQLTLGELIDGLKEMPSGAEVLIVIGDKCFGIGDLNSYRGRYSNLALSPSKHAAFCSVSMLLRDLQDAVRRTFRGYKGGDYLMDVGAPMWASPYGVDSGDLIVGVECVNDGLVKILTRKYGE